MKNEELISATECLGRMRQAGLVKFGKSYFSKLVSGGHIPYHEKPNSSRKWFYLSEVSEAIRRLGDPRREPQREANERRRSGATEQPDRAKEIETLRRLREDAKASGVDVVGTGEDIELLDAKELGRLIMLQDLRLKTAKADEAEGKVVPVDEVSRAVYEAARIMRDGLLGIPARVASPLAAMDDPHAVRTMLEEEIVRQLEGLSEALNGMC